MILFKKIFLLFGAATLSLALIANHSFAAGEAKPHLVLQGSVEKEVVSMKDGKRITSRIAADNPQRGDTLVFTVNYKNEGSAEAYSAGIVNQIPEGTIYELGSASGKDCEVLCSIDNGRTFAKPPLDYVVANGDGTTIRKPAPAEMYTTVKWIVQKQIKPGADGKVSFAVKVK